ncbi:unnamed protein product [Ambrosiozyma monospora]|nr:unnamed protein product [Ambrosiozyma monospora]
MLEHFGIDKEVENDFSEIKNVWWAPKWIPFTEDGAGQHYFIDLDPTDKGTVGQLGSFDHEVGIDMLLGKSFHEFFSNYVRDIYDGKYSALDGGLFDNI